MALPTNRLGSTDLNITSIGFGAWAAGGGGWAFSWGPQDDNESVAAMRRAIDAGINWIDTAAVYGYGHSEKVVGRFLRELPASDRPLVFTKCGLEWDDAQRMLAPKRILKPESIRRECEASLERLGVEQIDLYQFHWPDESGTPVEDSWATMVKLVEEGKIRAAGVSNFNVDLLSRCEAVRHVDSLQPPFSLINRAVGENEIPWCEEHAAGVICYSPMQSGILTETFGPERVAAFTEDDWRHRSPEFHEPNLSSNIALRDSLRPIAKRHNTSVQCVALSWVLSWPGVTGAIVGARNAKQVEGWLDAANIQLTSQDLDDITSALRATQAGKGPMVPAEVQQERAS
jgi:aryl-alcohol dehydrogenase-like predicted oxidoreductase